MYIPTFQVKSMLSVCRAEPHLQNTLDTVKYKKLKTCHLFTLPGTPCTPTEMGGEIVGLMCGAVTSRVLQLHLQCQACDVIIVMQIYPRRIYYNKFTTIKSRPMTLSRSPRAGLLAGL